MFAYVMTDDLKSLSEQINLSTKRLLNPHKLLCCFIALEQSQPKFSVRPALKKENVHGWHAGDNSSVL